MFVTFDFQFCSHLIVIISCRCKVVRNYVRSVKIEEFYCVVSRAGYGEKFTDHSVDFDPGYSEFHAIFPNWFGCSFCTISTVLHQSSHVKLVQEKDYKQQFPNFQPCVNEVYYKSLQAYICRFSFDPYLFWHVYVTSVKIS